MAVSGTSAIHSPTAMATSLSRRPARRRSSATRRSHSIRTTSATAGSAGRRVALPLTDREIPMIADDFVDPAFGSGLVKVTPAHDFNDYEVGQRHGLPLINVLSADAKIGDAAPARYHGLDRFEARKRIVAELEAAGLVEKVEPHRLVVPKRRPQRRRARTLADRPVVRAHRATRGTGDPRGRGRPHPVRAGELGQDVFRVDAQHQGLVHQPPALVGPPHPGLVRPGRRRLRGPQRSRRARTPWRARGHVARAGRGRARHLVFVGVVAILDARLAG